MTLFRKVLFNQTTFKKKFILILMVSVFSEYLVTVVREQSAVGTVIVTRTENGGGPGPVKGAGTPGPRSERGREKEELER